MYGKWLKNLSDRDMYLTVTEKDVKVKVKKLEEEQLPVNK